MPVIKQHKTVGNAFDGIAQSLAGCLGFFPGPVQGLVAALELLHGLVQCLGPLPNLLGKHHRVLEGGVGLRLVGRAGLHPDNQGIANPPQALVLRLKFGNPEIPPVFNGCFNLVRNGHQAGQ